MAGRIFFGSRFIGMSLPSDEESSTTWTLVQKVKEGHRQLDVAISTNTQATSFAHALFLCQDSEDPDNKALIRIHYQIPHAGSEFLSPEQRAQQASEDVNWLARSEFHALELSTAQHCQHLPTLISFWKGSQDANGFLPGGYVSYLLMTHLPGIRLGTNVEDDSLYWTSLSPSERSEIREAFKVAHRDLQTIGILPEFAGLKNLLWDQQSKKVYIIGFQGSEVEPNLAWRNNIWAAWGLAKPPANSHWYEAHYNDTDISQWTL